MADGAQPDNGHGLAVDLLQFADRWPLPLVPELLAIELGQAARETQHQSENVLGHGNTVNPFGIADHNRILLRFGKNQGFHAGRQGMDPAERFRLSVKRPDIVEPPSNQNVGIGDGAGGILDIRGDNIRSGGDPGDERLLAVGNGIENKNFR